eukprot:m.457225 g.457225  ORF g.457225 m.457225 type:complete len:1023 (+) comp21213_c0_seq1:57-3125(+)
MRFSVKGWGLRGVSMRSVIAAWMFLCWTHTTASPGSVEATPVPTSSLGREIKGCSRIGIAVLSKSSNVRLRMGIRTSWFRQLEDGVVARFFVNRPGDAAARRVLELEARFYNDMVLLDHPERYSNLILQTEAGYALFTDAGCPFIGKTDDDVYIRVPRVKVAVDAVLKINPGGKTKQWIGHMEAGATPLRSGRWKVTESEWPSSRGKYPPFGGGPFRMMSQSLAALIVRQRNRRSPKLKHFPLEDVGVGWWIKQLKDQGHKIDLIDDRKFFVFHYCNPTAHNVLLERGNPLYIDTVEVMKTMYQNELAAVIESATPFCPPGTTVDDVKRNADPVIKARLEQTSAALYKELDASWGKAFHLLQLEWARPTISSADPEDTTTIATTTDTPESNEEATEECEAPPCARTAIEIFWPQDGAWYLARVLGSVGSRHSLRYFDNSVEKLILANEKWRTAETLSMAVKDPSRTGTTTSSREPVATMAAPAESPTVSTPPDVQRGAPSQVEIGQIIEVFWPDDNAWYNATVTWIDTVRKMHLVKYAIDGHVEKLDLKKHQIRRLATHCGDISQKSVKQPTLPKSPVHASEGNSVPASSCEVSQSPIVVIVNSTISSWHWYLSGEGPVPDCATNCRFSYTLNDLPNAHAVVFTADDELYPPKEAVLPPKPATNLNVKYLAVLREFLPVYPNNFWKKYDGRITYRMPPDSFSVYNYAAPWVLDSARKSPTFEERSRGDLALIAFVSMRCGVPKGTDGRSQRTHLVESLQKLSRGLVDSYGSCTKNAMWPAGFDRDKHHVMLHHKFCIAIDNSVDDDYVTEKLWDCLAAGAVPIYRGAKNVAQYLPHGRESAIFIDDFASVTELAAHVEKVGANRTMWDSYRRWVREDPNPEWLEFMKIVDMRNVKCNLCTALRRANPSSERCSDSNDPKPKPLVLEGASEDRPSAPTQATENSLSAPDASTPAVLARPVRQWSVDDVVVWLTSIGFEADVFRENYVDGKLLIELDDEILRDDLKMTSKLQRKRLLLAVGELK